MLLNDFQRLLPVSRFKQTVITHQQRADVRTHIPVILHNQNGFFLLSVIGLCQIRHIPVIGQFHHFPARLYALTGNQRHQYAERGSRSTVVVGTDFPSMQFHNLPAKEQADTRTTLPVNGIFRTLFRLIETVEYLLHVLRHQSMPCVADTDIKHLFPAFSLDGSYKNMDAPVVRCKLDCIGNQVHHHLAHIPGVNHQKRIIQTEIGGDVNLPFFGKDFKRYEQLGQKLDEVRRAPIQYHLVHIQFPEIHQLVHQRKQIAGVPFGNLQLCLHILVLRFFQRMLDRAMNKRDRCPELMGDIREESNLLLRYLPDVLSHCFQLFVLDSQLLRTQFHFLLQPRFLFPVAPGFPLIEQIDGKTGKRHQQQIEPTGLIEIRCYAYFYLRHPVRPPSQFVRGTHLQRIVARRHRSIACHAVARLGFIPFVLIPFQAIGKTYTAAVTIILCSETDGKAVLLFVQRNPGRQGDHLLKVIAAGRINGIPANCQRRELHIRSGRQ